MYIGVRMYTCVRMYIGVRMYTGVRICTISEVLSAPAIRNFYIIFTHEM